MTLGRPTKYHEELCEIVLDLMYQGASIVEVAYELKIAKSTLYEWINKYPIFSDSIKKGVDFSEGYWMKEGRINIHNKEFNSTLFYMNMKNRFGWKDKVEQECNIKLDENTERAKEHAAQYEKY